MSVETEVRTAAKEYGELVAQLGAGDKHPDYSRFNGDFAGWVEHVWPGTYLWPPMLEAVEALKDHRLLRVQSANGLSKTFTFALYALYRVFACGSLVIITSAVERQVKHGFMREIARQVLAARGKLWGDLYMLALDLGRGSKAGILAFSAADESRFQGHHSDLVDVIFDESQGLPEEIITAGMACAVSEDSRVIQLGNPLKPLGIFFETSRSPQWKTFALSALDFPNILEGREVVRGAATQSFVDSIRETYGPDSPQYLARVLGQYPSDAAEQLIKSSWIDDAVRAWKARDAVEWCGVPVFAFDVAHLGPDRSSLATWQGGAVRSIQTWRQHDSVQNADRLEDIAEDLGVEKPETIIDATGLGWGCHDVLKERGWSPVAFVAAKTARDAERFTNCRSEAAWLLREALQARRMPVPDDQGLREELRALTWSLAPDGRIQLDSKDDIRAVLKRSPDMADALSMLAWHLRLTDRNAYSDLGGFTNEGLVRLSSWGSGAGLDMEGF